MPPPSSTAALPALILDSTLGRLAKWLRLAGMDVIYDSASPDASRLQCFANSEQRVVVTRSRSVRERLRASHCLYIRSNDVMRQARQVVSDLQLNLCDFRALTRCARCNQPFSPMSSREARGLVPDYILLQHQTLMTCTQCRRIYWPGTHTGRINSIIEGWFSKEGNERSA